MKFLKTLTKEEMEGVRSRSVRQAKRAIGQKRNRKLRRTGLALVTIKHAKENELYESRFSYNGKVVFYVVDQVEKTERAVCYMIY